MTIETIKRFVRKNWITVWLVVAAITLSGGMVLAKYATEHNVVRRVIATDGGAGSRFTSNYLFTGTENRQIRTVASTYTGEVTYDLFIYNYSMNNPTLWYKSDLDFSFTPTVVSLDGTTSLTSSDFETLLGNDSIEVYSVENETETSLLTINKDNFDQVVGNAVSQTITYSSVSGTYKRYKIVLPNSAIDKNICLKLEATPARKHGDISDLVLSSRFGAAFQTISLSTGWTGSFNDSTSIAPSAYEGFNFSITGSGDSSGELSWRSDLIEPNPNQIEEFFGVDLSSTTPTPVPGTNMVKITLPNLSSDDNSGRYDLQFYIKDAAAKTAIGNMDWDTFSETCVFTENTN